jgi:hypothetical protein
MPRGKKQGKGSAPNVRTQVLLRSTPKASPGAIPDNPPVRRRIRIRRTTDAGGSTVLIGDLFSEDQSQYEATAPRYKTVRVHTCHVWGPVGRAMMDVTVHALLTAAADAENTRFSVMGDGVHRPNCIIQWPVAAQSVVFATSAVTDLVSLSFVSGTTEGQEVFFDFTVVFQ